MNQDLTSDLLHEVFDYRDGHLYWRSTGTGRKDISKPAGYLHKNGYVYICINGKQHKAHRLIFLRYHGYLPEQIDHIDGNKTNNVIDNLRPATRSQNQHNRGKQKDNTSGYKGVTWDKHNAKWKAQICLAGKPTHLGCFITAEEAHEAYCQAANELHKDYANFG